MADKISVVINTLNEEENIERAINSVSWADEVVVCDMHSQDETVKIAEKLGVKIVFHDRTNYVEPARNFAVSKASGDWVLVLDADEEVPDELGMRLREMAGKPLLADFVEIPRKNIIFGKWMKASMWWPDLNIRFFKKGSVKWGDKIHIPPQTQGVGLKLPEEERYSLVHYHYTCVSQFVDRMNRYTTIQAKNLKSEGYKFNWADLIGKPTGEFLGRFFANRGFEDGVHGLALGLLQAFSFLVMYLKVWEIEKFEQKDITLAEVKGQAGKAGFEIDYWFKFVSLSPNPLKKFLQKVGRKVV